MRPAPGPFFSTVQPSCLRKNAHLCSVSARARDAYMVTVPLFLALAQARLLVRSSEACLCL